MENKTLKLQAPNVSSFQTRVNPKHARILIGGGFLMAYTHPYIR